MGVDGIHGWVSVGYMGNDGNDGMHTDLMMRASQKTHQQSLGW